MKSIISRPEGSAWTARDALTWAPQVVFSISPWTLQICPTSGTPMRALRSALTRTVAPSFVRPEKIVPKSRRLTMRSTTMLSIISCVTKRHPRLFKQSESRLQPAVLVPKRFDQGFAFREFPPKIGKLLSIPADYHPHGRVGLVLLRARSDRFQA